MGCDIHICIQRETTPGQWEEVVWQRQPYSFETNASNVKGVPIAPEHFDGRNYHCFAIIADVRNGRGFAGDLTSDVWPSIASNRGWPADFDSGSVAPNPKYPEEGPRGMGDHSFTFVMFDELRDFNWDAVTKTIYGFVPADVYEELAPRGLAPLNYCNGISGMGIRGYTPEEYAVAKHARVLVTRPFVRLSWRMTAREATGDWAGKVLPWLESLADGKPLRLVLGFAS